MASSVDKDMSNIDHVEHIAPAAPASKVTWTVLKENIKTILWCVGPSLSAMLWGFDIGEQLHGIYCIMSIG